MAAAATGTGKTYEFTAEAIEEVVLRSLEGAGKTHTFDVRETETIFHIEFNLRCSKERARALLPHGPGTEPSICFVWSDNWASCRFSVKRSITTDTDASMLALLRILGAALRMYADRILDLP